MLQNFLKIALRNLTKRKGYSLLNIMGLAVGMACCLLVFEYVAYERSYDSFQPNSSRIFRVQDEDYQNGQLVVPCAAAMPGVAPAMIREFPEVENAGRIRKVKYLLANEQQNKRFREATIYYADQAFLDIFQLPLLAGNAKIALSGPGKVVLAASVAKKYFGQEDPLGKILTYHTNGAVRSVQVSGVFPDYPENSHLKLSILISYPTYSQVIGTYGKSDDILETGFGWTDFYTYVLLRKGTDPKQLAAKLPGFIDKHYNDLPDNKSVGDRFSLSLIPLKDIHLYSHYTEEAEANGSGQSVSFLFLVAFFIIAIAWINYINLATARSLERAREVGVRKVFGAIRRGLILQFVLESLLLNLLALVVGLILALVANPFFIRLTGRPLPTIFGLPSTYWLIFATLLVLGTLVSAIYPALVLSRYQPVAVLKGLFKNAASGQWLRKSLIVGQFAASIILIAGTLVVYRQLQYMENQNLGADINRTLVLKGANSDLPDSAYQDLYQAFKSEILKIKGVKSMTSSSGVMGEEILWSTDWQKMGSGKKQAVNLFHLGVDLDFINGYGLKMVAGRAFSASFGAESKAIILNETAVRALGIPSPQAAIGVLLTGGQNDMDSLHVTGVVADYHNEGLQKAIQPLVLFLNRNTTAYYSVKVQGDDPEAAVAAIKTIWNRHFPSAPYEYFFLDEFFARQYTENRRFGEVFALFALLAIGIACFGLLGLSAYNVLQRTKEIGVRKVLGASIPSLVFVLTKNFLALVAIALLFAIPLTWLAMDSWLQGFAYRTAMSWWVLVGAGALAMFIALVTVGWQATRAAMTNPAKNLRTE